MRESIGGSWLFGIVATFVALFSAFLAYSISYTKAFNTKNEIINLIDHQDGYTMFNGGDSGMEVENASDVDLVRDGSVEALAFRAIKNSGYNYEIFSELKGRNVDLCRIRAAEYDMVGVMKNGYCLLKKCENNDRRKNVTYKVTTFVALKLPVLEIMIHIPVSGESRTISYDVGEEECAQIQ